MSDSFDKNQNEFEEQPTVYNTAIDEVNTAEKPDELSTVFSAPPEHEKEKTKKPFVLTLPIIGSVKISSSIMTIISACLAVAILVGGTIAVIKLIPEMNDEETSSSVFEDIPVVDKDSNSFETVTVKNKNGEFKFVVHSEASEGQTNKNWTVEGVEYSKLSVASVNSIISSAAGFDAMREITKDPKECGFDTPTVSVSVKPSKDAPYTILVGKKSPDGFGYYMMLEGSNKVYIANETEFSDFEFSLLDISDKTEIPTTMFSTDTSENKVEGSYAYFDSLTLSGKLFPDTITIVPNKGDRETDGATPYLITTPVKRIAQSESLSSPVALFSSTTQVAGNYALDVTDESIKEFGLDDPDAIVTMTINGEAKAFKFALVDDGGCAVVYDGATMIRKVDPSAFAFLSLKLEDYYYKSIFMNVISDIKSLTIKSDDEDIKFDITTTGDENTSKTVKVKANGKDIAAKNFTDYYKDFVNIECSDFTIGEVGNTPDCTVTFTYNDDAKQVIKLYKFGETQYQYSIDDIYMGKITSAAYNKMIKNLKTVAEGGSVY